MSGSGSGHNRNPNDREEKARKERERAARNLLSAKQSRERKIMFKAHLTAEKARLQESNAILRAQLDSLSGTSGAGPSRAGPSSAAGSSRSHHASGGGDDDMLQLSDQMSKLLGGRKHISSRAAVDLLDRALSGSAVKSAPVDPQLVRLWDEAQERAPKTRKPVYYDSPAQAAQAAMEIQAKKKASQEKKKKEQAAKAAKRAAAQKRGGSSSKRR